jgi:hypothetical protein
MKSIITIQTTHRALFKRNSKAICPIFDTEMTIKCQICAECDLDLCLHNRKLKAAHLSLRIAIRQHQAELRQAVRDSDERHAKDLKAANEDVLLMEKQHINSRQAVIEAISIVDEHHSESRQAANEAIRIMDEQYAKSRQAANEAILVMNERHAESRKALNDAFRSMNGLVGPLTERFKGIYNEEIERKLTAPPPSEETVSVTKQLDFDAMSVDIQLDDEIERSLSPDIDTIQKRPMEKVSLAAGRKWAFNEIMLEGIGGGC